MNMNRGKRLFRQSRYFFCMTLLRLRMEFFVEKEHRVWMNTQLLLHNDWLAYVSDTLSIIIAVLTLCLTSAESTALHSYS
mmetsp:Transcript_24382/g.35794  ORF Transcript_24382/g.35794 Transcript_24382/m.35794 type:complete len:80 (+) Transcript_24382:1003-1242(+)